ncbi:hypothetical protein [Nonlabens tegetincola]|uniref:hypothetical protein n=1 Tax=Nonlabens tegetincola TaxID=323273 RepID=UPI000CF40948|nr:hypothetical protein [Nonlabens tegetincola]PQJ21295.1 hypothetical protein BST93_00380 [Nonlabens tegetincola]
MVQHKQVITNPDGSWSVVVPAGVTTSNIDETTLPNGTRSKQLVLILQQLMFAAGTSVGEPADGFQTPEPNLSLDKVASAVADVNGNGFIVQVIQLTYSFTVTNNGNVQVPEYCN